MSTNYYLVRDVPMEDGVDTIAECLHSIGIDDPYDKAKNFLNDLLEPLHIGKSSHGWHFSLHVIPEKGINTLDDWKSLFYDYQYRIEDEYGQTLTPQEMMQVIDNRKNYVGTGSFDFKMNYAEPGLYGLARHKVDGRLCVGHGPGPYDYIVGEFS